MDNLPKELLHEIVSYLDPSYSDLWSCSLVCRAMWEPSITYLYKHIDLTIDERDDDELDAESAERQLTLLRSIAGNPKLGAAVRSFKNHQEVGSSGFQDATFSEDKALVIGAAQNMKLMSRANLTANPLAIHVVSNLQSYSHLKNLTVFNLRPYEHSWANAPTSLTNLRWEIPYSGKWGNPSDTIDGLMKMAQFNCPNLESLEISFSSRHWAHTPQLPVSYPERFQQYQALSLLDLPKLEHLRHFGCECKHWSGVSNPKALRESLVQFIRTHQRSLTSLSIPYNCGWTNRTIDFPLEVCALLPGLRHLTLFGKVACKENDSGDSATAYDSLKKLSKALASPKYSIQSFSLEDIGSALDKDVGKLFSSWSDLKVLRLGDQDECVASDGRLDVDTYRPKIIRFIEQLPQSLEELYIEINGSNIMVDDDEDFDPLCDFGPQIFQTLHRLHTCDIHAWISDLDGSQGWIPEKAVFHRRLSHSLDHTPASTAVTSAGIKEIWTSRLDAVYQENYGAVSKELNLLLPTEGGLDCKGKDAKEVWLGGYENNEEEEMVDYSWPMRKLRENSYEMFQKRW